MMLHNNTYSYIQRPHRFEDLTETENNEHRTNIDDVLIIRPSTSGTKLLWEV